MIPVGGNGKILCIVTKEGKGEGGGKGKSSVERQRLAPTFFRHTLQGQVWILNIARPGDDPRSLHGLQPERSDAATLRQLPSTLLLPRHVVHHPALVAPDHQTVV